jgi:predicted phage tail protein
MSNSLVNITLHGRLGEEVGKTFKLAVSSVKEAVRAINCITNDKLTRFLVAREREGMRYRILINETDLTLDEEITSSDPSKISMEKVLNSELTIKRSNIKTIDIIPIIEGSGGKSGGIFATVLGVILVVVGALTSQFGFGPALVVAGLGLIAAGVMVLLSKPPKIDDFRDSDAYGRKKASYLFDGPVNVTREGGPVPIGYGRLLIGSQVIQADYDINYISPTAYNTITPPS